MDPAKKRAKSREANPLVDQKTLQEVQTNMARSPGLESDCDGNDAVCFTAGFAGSMFGAGTIHAYLAADRKSPALVAGISMGAVNAVAMQRCYQELEGVKSGGKAEREVARWTWFREYLTSLTDDPLGAIWRGLPRKSDLGADLPPIRDTSLEEFTDKDSKEFLKDEEKRARRELYLFMRLGQWLARLPVKFSEIADLLVTYVRVKERVPGKGLRSKLKLISYSPASLLVPITWHLCLHPTWFPEFKFRSARAGKAGVRPLFGWPLYAAAWMLFIPMIGVAIAALIGLWMLYSNDFVGSLLKQARDLAGPTASVALAFLVLWVLRAARLVPAMLFSTLAFAAYSSWQFLGGLFRKKGRPKRHRWANTVFRWMTKQLFGGIELKRSLIHDFHLRLRLTRLFGKGGKSDKLNETPMPVLLVAAPLQGLEKVDGNGKRRGVAQVWARSGAPIVDALLAALALPGIYPPKHVTRRSKEGPGMDLGSWEVDEEIRSLDLVDGSVVRENPLPALFLFIKKAEREELARRLSSRPEDPRVHVVFSVPYGQSSEKREAGPLGLNIVDVLSTSLRLNRRRDTRMEIQQVNFMSELEHHLREATKGSTIARSHETQLHPIFANCVAPEKDIRFKNPLRPDAKEVLEATASGCRRTLETLYQKEIMREAGGQKKIGCHAFLSKWVKGREWRPATEPGMPEVCAACTGELSCMTEEEERSHPRPEVLEEFVNLTGDRPRIVFLASGGVFRGSFHAGMLAALLATDIRPDIIVGASVGTLIGGALGAMFSVRNRPEGRYQQSLNILRDLVDVLLHVDQRIAFTSTLKTAVREIGIRARGIRLSPNDVRRMVRKGARSDPGFAATGAPPALIDAFSTLLSLPHRKTSKIAADFVAGNVTEATASLLQQIKKTTLHRLDIEYALMGVSLLEPAAYRLLGEKYKIPLQSLQPFLNCGIAFFATATNLLTEEPRPLLLGLQVLDSTSSFDLVQAALASSAFPAVFAPRRESDVFPGVGRRDVLLADGGMFDNLPFVPTIELLADVQRLHGEKQPDSIAFLKKRHEAPDLFIAGSLNVPPEWETLEEETYDDMLSTVERASSLKDNLKIRAFLENSHLIAEEVELILKHVPSSALPARSKARATLDGLVETAVLPVFPADRDHLNPTYAFSASVGMKEDRVQRSIVHGCYQTLDTLASAQSDHAPTDLHLAHRSLNQLLKPYQDGEVLKSPRVPFVKWAGESGGMIGKRGCCPYFRISPNRGNTDKLQPAVTDSSVKEFFCPFFEAGEPKPEGTNKKRNEVMELYEVCRADRKHQQAAELHFTSASWYQNAMIWLGSLPSKVLHLAGKEKK